MSWHWKYRPLMKRRGGGGGGGGGANGDLWNLHNGPWMWSCRPNKLLHNRSCCNWFETAWCTCLSLVDIYLKRHEFSSDNFINWEKQYCVTLIIFMFIWKLIRKCDVFQFKICVKLSCLICSRKNKCKVISHTLQIERRDKWLTGNSIVCITTCV